MSSFVDGVSAAPVPLKARSIERSYFSAVGAGLVCLNLFTFLYHLSGSTLFNALGNAVSILIIAFSVFTVLHTTPRGITDRMFLVVVCVAMAFSLLGNWATTSMIDVLKYVSIYVFYVAGRSCAGRPSAFETRCIYVLAILPIVFLGLGRSKVYDDESFAYMANANTAVLYFSAILFALSQQYGNRVILFQFVNAALMNKVGAAVATVAAIGLWIVFPLRKETIIGICVFGICAGLAYTLGAFDRMLGALDAISMVLDLGPETVSSMSYKTLVEITGTTDLSAFFRIIHWSNIWGIYTDAGLGTILFGYGAGQTPYLTYAGLVPHNDYLRVLAEYGVFNLFVFVAFLAHVLRSLTTSSTKVLFGVLLIYFFSENLLDNFTSMAIYFAYAGRLSVAPVGPRTVVEFSPLKSSSDGRRRTEATPSA